jgi:ornithine cyclodeaminase
VKKGKIQFLSAADVEKALPMIEAVKEAFLQLSSGQAIVPLRTPMALPEPDGGALFMPAYLPECERIRLKTVTLFQRNPSKGLPEIGSLGGVSFQISPENDGRLEGNKMAHH